jgi:predicted CXXCH cytochrome family protein
MSNFLNTIKEHRLTIFVFIAGLILMVTSFGLTQPAAAKEQPYPVAKSARDDSSCLGCHSKTGFIKNLANGEVMLLTINEEHFSQTVHASEGLSCTDCHLDITGFPHANFSARSLREVSMQLYTVCKKCHEEQYKQTLDSIHQKELAGGNNNAAICTDCHNPHIQKQLTDPATGQLLPEARLQIPLTCARCHSAIYEAYKSSVHGAALTDEKNQDVPTCISCHGVHNIRDPRTNAFRANSPLLCSGCHTDPEIMNKYNIPTNVLNSYVSDFHGTTITLFEETNAGQLSNKPVCYDCHGVHDIKRTDDPVYGIAMKENLLIKCQVCHPDATANFPSAWMSHYIPSVKQYPLVYYINLFYKFLIPTVLGGMGFYVLTDFLHRMVVKLRGAHH